MTGLGERSHLLYSRVDLSIHIQDIVSVLHYDDVRDAILVGHSYGGMVITGVADRSAERVGKLVYLDAANPKNGESLVDVAGPTLELARPAGTTIDGMELVLLPSAEAGMFYGVNDPGDLAWMADRLTPHPWKCFEEKLVLLNEADYAKIPQFHVVCTSTLATRDRTLMEESRSRKR
jgi:pimeloyl-ACP methyl ester carboxylesterase